MEALGMLETLAAPREVIEALARYREALRRAAGENLVALAVYGDLARGRFSAGESDINLLVVVRDDWPPSVRAMEPVWEEAWREVRLKPFILSVEGVGRLAKVAEASVLSIVRSHVVVFGEDPLSGSAIAAAGVAGRVEKELRDLASRLQRRVSSAGEDGAALHAALEEAWIWLRVGLYDLLALAGDGLKEDEPSVVFAAAAERFGLDGAVLGRLPDARLNVGVVGSVKEMSALLVEVIHLTSRAADCAAGLGAS